MTPVVANIRDEWYWVRDGINEILEQFYWFDYRAEDVYAACVNGSAILYKTEEGFAVFTIEANTLTKENSFLCWLAWGKPEYKGNLIASHFDFFLEQSRDYGCERISVKTAIDGLDKFLVDQGWRVDMRVFSYDVGNGPEQIEE